MIDAGFAALRKHTRTTTVAAMALLVACGGSSDAPSDAPSGESEAELVARAQGIHERVITLDTHDDISPANFTAERNYTMDLGNQVNLPKMNAGGLDVAWLIVYVGQGDLTEAGFDDAYAQAVAKFDAIHRLTEEIAPDEIGLALTSDDVRRLVAEGKKVAMIGIENGYPVGMDVSRVREFAERGGRYMSLAHNGHSQLSDSNTGERDDVWLHGGLSDLGREVVSEMNRWGIMIDISHPSKEANLEMMRLSQAPVIASHSAARSLGEHSRNMDDEQLLALAENGGVIQTVASGATCGPTRTRRTTRRPRRSSVRSRPRWSLRCPRVASARCSARCRRWARPSSKPFMQEYEAVQAAADARMAAMDDMPEPVSVSDLVDHVDYLVGLIGLEHVGHQLGLRWRAVA